MEDGLFLTAAPSRAFDPHVAKYLNSSVGVLAKQFIVWKNAKLHTFLVLVKPEAVQSFLVRVE